MVKNEELLYNYHDIFSWQIFAAGSTENIWIQGQTQWRKSRIYWTLLKQISLEGW